MNQQSQHPPLRLLRRMQLMLRHGVLPLHSLRIFSKVLSSVGDSDVWLMYRKNLTEPLTPCAASIPIDIRIASDEQLAEAAALYHHSRPHRVARRAKWFRRRTMTGSFCFVALIDGKAVAYNWIRTGSAIGAHKVLMRLKGDEIYTTDAFTAHAVRGNGIHTALNYAMLRFAQASGYRTAYTMLRIENIRSWITMPRVGWQLSGVLGFYRSSRKPEHPRWLVFGDAYPMPVSSGIVARGSATHKEGKHRDKVVDISPANPTADSSSDIDALVWAQLHYSYSQSMMIRDAPWCRTYSLHGSDNEACLKVLAQPRPYVLCAIARMALAFPRTIPDVIACDDEKGWLLGRSHESRKPDYDASGDCRFALIETYARLQSNMLSKTAILEYLPVVRRQETLVQLFAFLDTRNDERTTTMKTRAASILGSRYVRKYHGALSMRHELLDALLEPVDQLPDTVNHCGLRPANAAMKSDGSCVIFNWTDAVRGPAGLSLHALFSGCMKPIRLLNNPDPVSAESGFHARLLQRYIDTLVEEAYVDERTLRKCLPASIALGVMHDVANFSRFDFSGHQAIDSVRQNLKERLDDLLDLCDLLSSQTRQSALAHALDYRKSGNLKRARWILEEYLSPNANDAFARSCLATVLTELGDSTAARIQHERALDLDPQLYRSYVGLALILEREMEYGRAADCFDRAIELEPDCVIAKEGRLRVQRLEQAWSDIRQLHNSA